MTSTPTLTYDLTEEIRQVCFRLATNVEGLSHIDLDRVLFGLSVSRVRGKHGVYAACHPLRFEGGKLRQNSDGRTWEWPVIRIGGNEMLYYISFYVPRFLNLKPLEKLETIVHELYHISPRFDGDLRRLGRGRHAYHGPSLAHYQRLIAPLIEEGRQSVELSAFPFMQHTHRKLSKAVGRIVGSRVKRIKPRFVPE